MPNLELCLERNNCTTYDDNKWHFICKKEVSLKCKRMGEKLNNPEVDKTQTIIYSTNGSSCL
jgi:Ca2+-binding EF-hand superfamily protein